VILWHLGGTVLIARYVFKDAAMDLRWLMFGALLPDLIDKPIASIIFHDTFGTHRAFGHALVFPVVLMTGVMIATRRGAAARKAAIAVVIGVFVHLILDAVWLSPDGFLWPLFGFEFPAAVGSDFPTLVRSMVTNPLVWAGEALGAAYLGLLWWRHLRRPGALRRFARDGRIPMERQDGPAPVC
jgi:inner membrane protein